MKIIYNIWMGILAHNTLEGILTAKKVFQDFGGNTYSKKVPQDFGGNTYSKNNRIMHIIYHYYNKI